MNPKDPASVDAPCGSRVSVVIADDHDSYRRGLAVVVGLDACIDVVGEAANGEDVVRVCEESHPDVVLMDVRMPRATGIEAASRVRTVSPDSRIVMMTMSDDPSDLLRSVASGASGYVLKDVPGDEVNRALHCAARGEIVMPTVLARALVEMFDCSDEAKLTARERAALEATARGDDYEAVAADLGVTTAALTTLLGRIMKKARRLKGLDSPVASG